MPKDGKTLGEIRVRGNTVMLGDLKEIALYKHPSTQLAAVVACPDEKWGETPCAFVELKPAARATEQDYIDWCRQNLARFKIPKKVVSCRYCVIRAMFIVGIDVGGTFTDLTAVDEATGRVVVTKVPSRPAGTVAAQ